MTTSAPDVQHPRAVDDQNPWPGLAAFEEGDADFFKGRDDEISALMRVLRREDLVLFWGLSGLGKTSLLRAGLFPRLRAGDIFPVYIRLRYEGGDDASLWEQCFTAIRHAGERWGYEVPAPAPSGTIWEYVRRRDERFWAAGDRLATPMLVFDQFEEVFTRAPADERRQREIATFFRDVADAITGALPESLAKRDEQQAEAAGEYLYRTGVFKVLLSFREDFLAQVAGFAPLVRAIDHNHARIDSMTFDQALKVVADSGGHLIASVSDEERRAICQRIVERVAFVATPAAQRSATVDPALLSLFCRELNEQRRAQGKDRIDRDLVESGEASQIISRFYESCASHVTDGTRRVIEDWLVLRESRTRGSLAQEKALQLGASAADLDFLIDKRILRREETTRRGQPRIELTHDILVEPAIAAGERRRIEEQRAQEALRAEESRRKLAEARERERQELLLKVAAAEAARAGAVAEQARIAAELAEGRASYERLRRSRLQRLVAFGGVLLAVVVAALLFVFAAQRRAERALATAGLIQASSKYGSEDRNDIALAYLAYAIRRDPDNAYARGKLVDFLLHRTWPARVQVLRHEGPVLWAQFSRDGRRLLTTSAGDSGLTVWQLDDREPLPRQWRPGTRALFARFEPQSGQYIASLSVEGTVDLWDSGQAITADQQGTRAKHPLLAGTHTQFTWVSFSPDGALVVTGSDDGMVRVWRVQQPDRLVLEFQAHDSRISTVQFSSEGRRLLSAGADGTAAVWDAENGREIGRLTGDSGTLVSAQFSPDGTRIVTASRDGNARLWRAPEATAVPSGSERRVEEPVILPHKGAVWSAQFSPDGSRIVTASEDGTAGIWDARVGTPLPFVLQHRGPVVTAFFSGDGQRIVTASRDKSARVWDTESGAPLTEPLWHDGPVQSATFSPDGERVVSASDDGQAVVWDVRPAVALPSAIRTSGDDWADFAPDGAALLLGGSDSQARVWNLTTSQITHVLDHPARVSWGEVSRAARLAITVAGASAVLWSTETWQPVGQRLDHSTETDAEISVARFSPDGSKVLTVVRGSTPKDRTLRVWDARSGRPIGDPLQLRRHDDDAALPPLPIRWAEFDTAGRRIAAAADDETGAVVVVWEVSSASPRVQRRFSLPAEVSEARFAPDGHWLATVGGDNIATLWPLNDSGSTESIRLPHDAPVGTARFSPRGDRLVTTSDTTARLWAHPRGTSVGFALPHNKPVYWADFSPDGLRVVTLSRDGQARLWDSQTGDAASLPLIHPGAFQLSAARFSPDGEQLATAADDGFVRLWHVPVGRPRDVPMLASLAEAVSGYAVRDDGTLVRIDAVARWAAERERVPASGDRSTAAQLARWMLQDRWARTISPFSTITIDTFVRERLASGDQERRREVLRAYPGHPAVRGSPSPVTSESGTERAPVSAAVQHAGVR